MSLPSYLPVFFSKVISILTSNSRDWFCLLGPYSDGIVHYELDVCKIDLCSSGAMASSFSLVYSIPLYEFTTWIHPWIYVFLKSSSLPFTLLFPLSTDHPAHDTKYNIVRNVRLLRLLLQFFCAYGDVSLSVNISLDKMSSWKRAWLGH